MISRGTKKRKLRNPYGILLRYIQIPIWNMAKLLHYVPFWSTNLHVLFLFRFGEALNVKQLELNNYFDISLTYLPFFRSFCSIILRLWCLLFSQSNLLSKGCCDKHGQVGWILAMHLVFQIDIFC